MIVNGTTANTNIPVTGILTTDTLQTVFLIEGNAGTAVILGITVLISPNRVLSTNITAFCSITSNGNIQSTLDTTNKILVVSWTRP